MTMKNYVESFSKSYEKQMSLTNMSFPILDTQFDDESEVVQKQVVDKLRHMGFKVIIGESDGYKTIKLLRRFSLEKVRR